MKKSRSIILKLLIIPVAIDLFYILPTLFGHVGSEAHEWQGLIAILISIPVIVILAAAFAITFFIDQSRAAK